MSGSDSTASRQPPEASPASADQRQPQQPQQQHPHAQSAPFQSQLEYLAQSQQHQSPQNMIQYGQQAFDMGALAGALPGAGQPPMTGRSYVSPDPSTLASPHLYQPGQAMYPPQRGPQFADPAALARAQQQHMMGGQYMGPGPLQVRPQGFPMQPQLPYSPVDPYGYGMSHGNFSPMDPRFAQQPFMMPPGMATDLSQFTRRCSAAEAGPIPNFPRGPPRKPKQSGHALWVGNLPPQAVVTDLKDHFSRDATQDIESVFLIAKSNCAFVNYKSEAACVAAMNRFHDSRFHGVRLVCRLRRGTTPSSTATPTEPLSDSPPASAGQSRSPAPVVDSTPEDSHGPTIARSQSDQSGTSPSATGPSEPAPGEKVPEKYFIVKSLTAQDLEASVRNGIWATQSHNENALNKAYDQAESVYLIFSANKSGEYFGYARMASMISGEPVNLSSAQAPDESPTPDSAGSPQSIPTPATATAPKGRIIDDSARGTIFWEADHTDSGEGSPAKEGSSPGQNWGKQFQIEWMSTTRLPFYRTRGLRNPWNANREVKIARDGTELEPSIGRRLVQMFHRPSPSSSTGPAGGAPGGMPYAR
ncbi:Zinc finger CCCH domain-containing 45 [Lecanosticta acicola]|uniref:Zinc finger CCCH domain-containing 45 n=1 Tax=Lecanosticta acicola TaxID=111012 RepID=A0AAI8YYX6_9PEZI|nr:Zinc finger CCCH domain-containing 45 [Lecanosticta acicola]